MSRTLALLVAVLLLCGCGASQEQEKKTTYVGTAPAWMWKADDGVAETVSKSVCANYSGRADSLKAQISKGFSTRTLWSALVGGVVAGTATGMTTYYASGGSETGRNTATVVSAVVGALAPPIVALIVGPSAKDAQDLAANGPGRIDEALKLYDIPVAGDSRTKRQRAIELLNRCEAIRDAMGLAPREGVIPTADPAPLIVVPSPVPAAVPVAAPTEKK